MEAKKAFTLVELLVAMAIIAILLGLAVFGITIVQQNARDTQRRAKVNDVEIALNGLIAGSVTLPDNLTAAAGNTAELVKVVSTDVALPGILQRGATPFESPTTTGSTNYCYSKLGSLYVVGVTTEGGAPYFKTNSGATYTAFDGTGPTNGAGPCANGKM